jgi:CheY-like chemotaxis protein
MPRPSSCRLHHCKTPTTEIIHSIPRMPHRILIVDDNESLRAMFRETFSGHGFEVVVAESVAESLRAAAHYAVDAVLTDLEIPGASGLEFCEVLKQQKAVLGRRVCLDATRARSRKTGRRLLHDSAVGQRARKVTTL